MDVLSELYFGTINPKIDETAVPIISRIFTDSWFQMPAIYTAKKLAQKAKSDIFMYYYTYPGSVNMCDLINIDMTEMSLKVSSYQYQKISRKNKNFISGG